ncbi:MAG: NADH-quinone oxidoreductase subunit N [Anaerolineae bacterium]
MTGQDLLLLLPEIVLTVAAFLVFTLDIIWRRGERKADWLPWLAVLGAAGAFVATLFIWPLAGPGAVIATDLGGTETPMLAVDRMALFFKLVIALVVALVGLSAISYVPSRTPYRGEFYALMMLAGLSAMLVSSSTNLVMIYLAFEFLSITSYVLTGYLRQDERSTEAALKYFLYGAVASAVMLYGFSLLYGATGTVDLTQIARGLGSLGAADRSIDIFLAVPAIIMVLAGLGFKVALVPFHQWTPEAYEGAPTPIAAFLSVGSKAAGFGVLIRILVVALPAYELNWVAILIGISIITMTLGNLVALWQTDIKRLLAYSSISNAGFILIGLAALNPNAASEWAMGLNGLLLFLFAYLFTNLGAFAVVIAVENATGSTRIAEYAGLIRRSPFLAIAMFIFLLSLIGIPPTGGFVGKLFVFGAAIGRAEPRFYLLAGVGIVNSVISVYYYFKIARNMFFEDAGDAAPLRAGGPLAAVVTISMVMTLLIAIFMQPFIDLATDSVQILASIF